jgi:hypothetical protein
MSAYLAAAHALPTVYAATQLEIIVVFAKKGMPEMVKRVGI